MTTTRDLGEADGIAEAERRFGGARTARTAAPAAAEPSTAPDPADAERDGIAEARRRFGDRARTT